MVQVKDNQPTLHQAIAEIAATAAPSDATRSHDIGRNRADSDEAARVHRSDAARRSNLMAPIILI